ncbi:MAG TPA: YciI family protein [Longimicrobium sp.]|nr:YciI family protein [Longimicrobium sp.]
MKYMLLINVPYAGGGYDYETWPPEAWQAHLDYLVRLNQGLVESGELVGVQGLEPPAKARVVRAGRKPAVTDGPFPESKEFLAGFWTVDVESAARACEIAAQASAAPGPDGAPLGMPIEVRQVMGGPPPEA